MRESPRNATLSGVAQGPVAALPCDGEGCWARTAVVAATTPNKLVSRRAGRIVQQYTQKAPGQVPQNAGSDRVQGFNFFTLVSNRSERGSRDAPRRPRHQPPARH